MVAAIVAGIFAALAYRREVLRDRARDDELRELRDRETQAQASLVAVWLSNEGPIPRDAEVLPRIRVRNGSQIPVYSTVVTFHDTRGRNAPILSHRIGTLAPTGDAGWENVDVDEVDQYVVLSELAATAKRDEHTTIRLEVELRFTDAAGVRWLRADTGVLVSIPPVELPMLERVDEA